MKRDDVMIDLETLDTNVSTVILSIGACRFDVTSGQVLDEFYRELDVKDQISDGRTIGIDTLKWWLTQDRDLLAASLEGAELLRPSLMKFFTWCGDATVWSNGATFDIAILEHAFASVALVRRPPWRHWGVRDVRTIRDLARGILSKTDIPFEGQRHNALDDARYQARYVSAMWQALRS